jgi:hypothetical protein
MATVYLGRMTGSVGFARTVAIKRLHPHLAADPALVAMLVDEARLVSRIHHPNVVPTLDVVQEQGELFLVMEYVKGESLARLVRSPATTNHRIPPDIVATILVGILHGLHAAHEARSEHGELLGIVHRDVSPQNILVGIDGVPRLVDFGVAKAAGRVGQDTRDGQLKGKLAYMSPEQIRGTVDRRTDIYAASVVLWEALTGKRLFPGQTEIEVFAKVAEGNTTPPSQYAPDIPAILDAVTLRGFHRDPEQRYQTAREMARDLEDAIPLVAASRIGEWVEVAAQSKLLDRAKRVELIESDSALKMRTPAPPELGSGRLPGAAPPERLRAGATPPEPAYEAPSTQLSAVSAGDVPPVAVDKGHRAKLLAAVLVGLSVTSAVGVLAFLALRSSTGSPSTAAATSATPAPSASAPEVVPSAVAAPTTSSSAAARAPGTSTATAPTTRADPGVARPSPPHVGRDGTSTPRPPSPPPHPQATTPPPSAPPKAPTKEDTYDHM